MNSKSPGLVSDLPSDKSSKFSWQTMALDGTVGGLLLLLALALRVHQLSDVTAWYDEASTWKTIQFSWSEMFQSIQRNVHPPVYYVVLKLWAGVWGASSLSLRSFSVACGVATVGVLGLIAREVPAGTNSIPSDSKSLRTRAWGWLVPCLYAINPLAIEQSQQARMYALGILFAALLGWGTLRVLRSPERGGGWWLVIVFGHLLPLTHYYGLLTSLIAATLIAIRLVNLWRQTPSQWRSILTRCGGATAVSLLVCLAWGPVFLQQHARVQADYWIQPFTWSEPVVFGAEWVSSSLVRSWGWSICVSLFVVGLVGILSSLRCRSLSSWTLVALALGPPVLSTLYSLASRNLLQGRYWSFAHLFFIVSVGIAIERISSHWVRRGLIAVLIAGSLFWVIQDRRQRDHLAFDSGLRGAASVLQIARQPDEMVLVASPFYHPSIQRYLASPERVFVPATGDPYTHFQGGAILRPGEIIPITETLKGNSPKLWVVVDDFLSHSLDDPTQLPIPAEWQLARTFKFHEGNRLATNLEIREYIRQSPPPAAK